MGTTTARSPSLSTGSAAVTTTASAIRSLNGMGSGTAAMVPNVPTHLGMRAEAYPVPLAAATLALMQASRPTPVAAPATMMAAIPNRKHGQVAMKVVAKVGRLGGRIKAPLMGAKGVLLAKCGGNL